MHHSLQRRHPRHPPVEVIVGPKVPARQPHDNVVPHAEEPDEGEVGKGDDARSVGHEAEDLVGDGWVAFIPASVSHVPDSMLSQDSEGKTY